MAASEYIRKVITTVRRIPKGKVASYGEVAEAAGYPGAARAVASALRAAPPATPWYRVLGAGGRIALKGPGAYEQRIRLEAEGVRFRGTKVDMKQFHYVFPGRKRSPHDSTSV